MTHDYIVQMILVPVFTGLRDKLSSIWTLNYDQVTRTVSYRSTGP